MHSWKGSACEVNKQLASPVVPLDGEGGESGGRDIVREPEILSLVDV